MNEAFLRLESLRQSLVLNAQNHAWSACLPLTESFHATLANLPPPENDSERSVLAAVFADFSAMCESALAEHKDIQKLLNAFDQTA